MNQTQEFLQGSIANDYREILDSAFALETAAKKKVPTGKGCSASKHCPKPKTGKECSNPHVCPKPKTGKECSNPNVCPKPETGKECSSRQVCPKPETGKDCSSPHVCRKAMTHDFQPAVPGWSYPPAPPMA